MSVSHVKKPQRGAFRREVLLSCEVVRERDFRLVSSLALDLSPAGMLVSTELPVLTGEELFVSFRAPRSDQWFDQRAVVARVVHGRRPGDRGRCLGLAFHDMDDATMARLERHLRGLPPPEPARPWALGATSARAGLPVA